MRFTSTETCRPDLLRRSCESIVANLRGVDLAECKLFINVDPAPLGACPCDVVDTAECFFGEVVANKPNECSFPKAFRWCMNQPTDEIFFHFEFDWLLLQPVYIHELIEQLNNDPAMACVNLRAYGGIHDDRICLSPGLWRTSHAREIARRMTDDKDPESQLRQGNCQPGGAALGFKGCQHPSRGQPIIADIGRKWLAEHGLRKNMGNRLTKWEAA